MLEKLDVKTNFYFEPTNMKEKLMIFLI